MRVCIRACVFVCVRGVRLCVRVCACVQYVLMPAQRIVAIALGGSHTCALSSDGKVQCLGRNSQGQLGTGSTGRPENLPLLVAFQSGATRVRARAGRAVANATGMEGIVVEGEGVGARRERRGESRLDRRG